MIAQSVDDGASDIHFEPQAKELVVRFRIDGVLHEIMSVPRRMQSGVITRLKIMAELDIAERRVPQDGRIGPGRRRQAHRHARRHAADRLRREDRHAPARQVERDARTSRTSASRDKALKRFQRSFTKPYGAILVTGPTGSGKSTTLYATLNILNSTEKNVITVEDPVEYRLTGINQVQVNTKAGLTFAAALRSILRCDPDIVMIGEIRDRETAQIAIESALTGHLVLSYAPHQRRARRAVSPHRDGHRTLPHLVGRGLRSGPAPGASSLQGVQGALRTDAGDAQEERLPARGLRDGQGRRCTGAKGCSRCNNTGYKGRLGLYEVMIVSEAIRRLTVERKSADEISRVAAGRGHEEPARGRHRQGAAGHDLDRRDRPRHHLTAAAWRGDEDAWTWSTSCLEVLERDASDLHLTVGSPPIIRVNGVLERLDYPRLGANDTRELIYSILSQDQRQRLENEWEMDFSYSVPGRARFRVNAYFQRNSLGAAFRLIPVQIKKLEELGLPKALHQLTTKPRGFVVVTGPPARASRPPWPR